MKKGKNRTGITHGPENKRFIPLKNPTGDKEILLPIHAAPEKNYNRDSDEDMDPEGLIEMEMNHKLPDNWNEIDFSNNETGNDPDEQGAVGDDKEESIRSEDDFKNYYNKGAHGQAVLDEGIIN